MRKILLISVLFSFVLLPSCGVYTKYQPETLASTDTTLVSLPEWREFFTDPLLQELIDSALVRNTSITVASIRLRQSGESLRAARLAYSPIVSFSPFGSVSKTFSESPSYSYSIPIGVNWEIGPPGSLFARRHQAIARQIQEQDNLNAVRNEIICRVAADYYYLQMLDKKIVILEETIDKWMGNIEIQRELMSVGKTFYNSVAQMESKIMEARQDLLKAKADIETLERSMCLVLATPFRHIERSKDKSDRMRLIVDKEVSMAQLRRRPDVRAAERDLEICYYLTSEAKSAFYPSIKLSGDFGWPMLINAAASLIQPIFTQGTLRTRLNISKMEQEIAHAQFSQILLQAASEVCQSLADYRLYAEKESLYSRQIENQTQSSAILGMLQRDGTAKYLEVIKAEESLLEARVDECESIYKQQEAAIMLYKSLAQ